MFLLEILETPTTFLTEEVKAAKVRLQMMLRESEDPCIKNAAIVMDRFLTTHIFIQYLAESNFYIMMQVDICIFCYCSCVVLLEVTQNIFVKVLPW